MLDINLIGLVARESHKQVTQGAFLQVVLQLILVQVILALVSEPGEQDCVTCRLTCGKYIYGMSVYKLHERCTGGGGSADLQERFEKQCTGEKYIIK